MIFTNEIPEALDIVNCPQVELHNNNRRLFGNKCNSCGKIVTYVDDITLVVANKSRTNNQLKLNINLARLEAFLSSNELVVNVDKTAIQEAMIKQKKGRTKGDPPHLIVEDPKSPGNLIKIADSKELRLLGANFQPNMNWQSHLVTGKKAVFPQIRKQLGALKQMGDQLPQQSRKALADQQINLPDCTMGGGGGIQ